MDYVIYAIINNCLGGLIMKINIKKAYKVYGYYYYCTICNKQIDYYVHLKYDGKCELCYYC